MSVDRRSFLAGLGAGTLATLGSRALGAATAPAEVRSVLLHMGTNMWCDVKPKHWGNSKTDEELALDGQADHLRCDEEIWKTCIDRIKANGLNQVVIDVGEALVFPSHPELAVKGSWTPDRLRAELARIRALGIEVIPKLNFSTCHDVWLKDYQRMVSTSTYYKVCADVIRDVCEVFGHPRWFHLGYDEETAANQDQFEYVAVRQGELWWHDFLFFVKTVEGLSMRPWIWSDYYWHHPELFLQRMPKSVLQSNWYYGRDFVNEKGEFANKVVKAYADFDKAGFDQVPCGSNWGCDENFAKTVKFCRANVSPAHLKGFLMAPWYFAVPLHREKLLRGIELAGAAFRS